MDKFLFRQAAAEGINLDQLKTTLLSISKEAAENVGDYHPNDLWTKDKLSREIGSCTQTRGGYMYSSSTWTVEDGRDPFQYTLEWTKGPGLYHNVDENAAVNKGVLEDLPVGAKVMHSHQGNDDTVDTYVKQADGSWLHNYQYCGQTKRWATESQIYLYPGIRQQVADRLSVPLSSTFHKCFDACVDTFYA